MKRDEAVARLMEVMQRQHLALNTRKSYAAWLRRYCDCVSSLPVHLSSERKVERFLSALAQENVSASTQNQAFNAVLFFYREVLRVPLANIDSLRARRPKQIRRAPTREETVSLLREVQAQGDFATGLAVRLLYGCGLRVTEALSLRIKDIDFSWPGLAVRGGKGQKDRVVALPCSVLEDLREQMESARVVWKRDQLNKIPVALPDQLAKKYPAAQFDWNWAWLFPAHRPVLRNQGSTEVLAHGHGPTGDGGAAAPPYLPPLVRWRLHEANVQRAVRNASRRCGVFILPHELRHAYATHCLNRGANPRAIQEAMGHQSLETTMGYLHAEALSVGSPLD